MRMNHLFIIIIFFFFLWNYTLNKIRYKRALSAIICHIACYPLKDVNTLKKYSLHLFMVIWISIREIGIIGYAIKENKACNRPNHHYNIHQQ